ncbi:hypothetical protein KR009_008343 [Drosophila setifemur]|nr:hypothetical protein KR009_008343 [Drosophila setifemur]
MLHPKLGRVLSLVYHQAAIYALMGTTLRIRSWRRIVLVERISWTYLAYSVLVSGYFLFSIYFILPSSLLDGYIKQNLVLQWNFIVMTGLRVLAIFSCYGTIWLRRREIVQLYRDSLSYWRKFRFVMELIVVRKDLREMQISLAGLMWKQIFLSYATLFFSTVVQYQLMYVINQGSLIAFGARISQFLHYLAFKITFFGVLILLKHQFMVIHLALKALQDPKFKERSLALRSVASMRLETVKLAKRLFRLYDIANAALFANMFMSTINILYHAVQYSNQTIKSDGWGKVFGNGLIIFNSWGTMIQINMLDSLLNSCNNVGEPLKQFSDLPRISKNMQRELDAFAMQLRRYRLTYKIFGIVNLDKSEALGYIGSILSNVIILMQFDLRLKSQPGHNYLIHLARNQTNA